MPEPTKLASAPSCIINAASAGVAIPPAAKLGTGSFPSSALLSTDNGSTYKYLAYNQNITMVFNIKENSGRMHYTFPHLTSNVVTKV